MEINYFNENAVQDSQVKNTIDTVFVERFFNGMLRMPYEIRLRFKTINGIPGITVTMTYKNKREQFIKEELTTIANGELINAVLQAMHGSFGTPDSFLSNHDITVEDTSENFELEMFEKFIKSEHIMKLLDDFISPRKERYLHVIFPIGFRKDVHFYLKRDEHVEALLNEALSV